MDTSDDGIEPLGESPEVEAVLDRLRANNVVVVELPEPKYHDLDDNDIAWGTPHCDCYIVLSTTGAIHFDGYFYNADEARALAVALLAAAEKAETR